MSMEGELVYVSWRLVLFKLFWKILGDNEADQHSNKDNSTSLSLPLLHHHHHCTSAATSPYLLGANQRGEHRKLKLYCSFMFRPTLFPGIESFISEVQFFLLPNENGFTEML
ncbi:hypothetical protein CHARACLAT_029550 [Characodon lateralis]|uniref:Uncharacterized protein n=1 Tax=Characodon lateralis TaxID=208331 RepID=A0ABU7F7H2_9TELE|nr:hypothetical protein [Characodon lateralis]